MKKQKLYLTLRRKNLEIFFFINIIKQRKLQTLKILLIRLKDLIFNTKQILNEQAQRDTGARIEIVKRLVIQSTIDYS